jgi:hypothetical protein
MAQSPTITRSFLTRTSHLATANTLGSSARHEFTNVDGSSPITIHIDHTSGRTFRCVILEVTARAAGTSNSLLGVRLGIKLGSASYDDQDTSAPAHLGANHTWQFTRDVTSYFNTNFGGGTSQTCLAAVAVSTDNSTDFQCLTARLHFVYDFTPDGSDELRTAWIVIDGNTAYLASPSLTELGTFQIPQLTGGGGLIPGSITAIDDWHIFSTGSDSNPFGNTTTTQISLALDSESADDRGVLSHTATGCEGYIDVWKRTPGDGTGGTVDCSVHHAFKVACDVASRFHSRAFVLAVTYRCAAYADGDSMLISRQIPVPVMTPGALPDSTNALSMEMAFVCPEANPVLKQSGLLMTWGDAANGKFRVKVGTQTDREYSVDDGYVLTTSAMSHRVDAGAAAGSAGITLAQGLNRPVLSAHTGNVVLEPLAASGMLYLNYVAQCPAGGAHLASRTTRWTLIDTHTATLARNFGDGTAGSAAQQVPVLPSGWALASPQAGFEGIGSVFSPGQFLGGAEALDVEQVTGEDDEIGLRYLSRAIFFSWYGGLDNLAHARLVLGLPFRRWQGRAIGMDPTTSRRYRRSHSGRGSLFSWVMLLDVHGVKLTKSRTLKRYSGDGSGITVSTHDATTGEKVSSTTSTTGGAYTASTFNAGTYFDEAIQDSNHLGRSDVYSMP